jgi:hypothetical protein
MPQQEWHTNMEFYVSYQIIYRLAVHNSETCPKAKIETDIGYY